MRGAGRIGRLTALQIGRVNPGYYADGAGLYLQVSRSGAKFWLFRYRLRGHLIRNGKPLSREMGLGSLEEFGLADAREAARQKRQLVHEGIDHPIEARDGAIAQKALEAAKCLTFSEATERFLAAHRAGWSNPKHARQWGATLRTYAAALGPLPV